MPDLVTIADQIRTSLANGSRAFWQSSIGETAEGLRNSQVVGDSAKADRFWFLHKIAVTRHRFLQSIEEIKAGEYFDAWCGLERVEIDLSWLRTNRFFDPKEFGVFALERHVVNWQALFPYSVFFSPAFLEKRKECAVCGTVVDPWDDCGHEVGKVYGGKECIHIVTDMLPLHIAIVRDPVQKYSVAHTVLDSNGKAVDHHNYSAVKFVADRLNSPFDRWSIDKTKKLHPHSRYSATLPGDVCPCESGQHYADCCLLKPGVLMPHIEIGFERPLPADLPSMIYADDDFAKAAESEPS